MIFKMITIVVVNITKHILKFIHCHITLKGLGENLYFEKILF